jgi:hypothetical protein
MKTAIVSESKPSAAEMLQQILPGIVGRPETHGRWLNSLAYMEHVGATKIAKTQSGEKATYTTLKHAAEEARHGFFLKKLALKVWPELPQDFRPEGMLAAVASRQYLHRLDIGISRILRNAGIQGEDFGKLAYLLVTYAIEMRADDLYPVYQAAIEGYPVKISVRTIINEEEGHLAEMQEGLAAFNWETAPLMEAAIAFETGLFHDWISEIKQAAEAQ